MRRFNSLLLLGFLAASGCRRASTNVLPMQDAAASPITGAFGKTLGERWPSLPAGAEPEKRSDLYIFAFAPAEATAGLTRYRAWVNPSTMEICRITGRGDLPDDKAFAELFQRIEALFGPLSPLSPAESFKPPDRNIWSVTRDGRTVLVVRRKDGQTTVDLFDVFLGSRPLEEILSAKGARDSEF